jgi:hypothetical protein
MYQPNSTKKNQQHQEEMERWPLITFIKSILDGRVGADQKIEGLNDDFEYYLPMDEALPFEEKQRVRRITWTR